MKLIKYVARGIEEFFRNLGDIVVVFIALALVEFLLSLVISAITGVSIASSFTDNSRPKLDIFLLATLGGIVTNSILGANLMALLDMVRGKQYNFSLVVEKFQNNYANIIVVAGIISMITNIVSVLPLGGILEVIVEAALCFSFLFIEDFEAESPFSYVVASYEKTKGHKMNLFLIKVIVGLLPFLIWIVLVAATLIQSLFLGGAIIGILMAAIFALFSSLITIITHIARIFYYEDHIMANYL